MRTETVCRETAETRIEVSLNLDGTGTAETETGVAFFDHMLEQVARHAGFDLTVRARGDLDIDAHHTIEDVGICLGQALTRAVGNPAGLTRYGHAVLPMDDALAEVAVDYSGRPYLRYAARIPGTRAGELDTELVEEFFRAFAMNSRMTVHVTLRYGENTHHCVEIMFKAFARALRQAMTIRAGETAVPSTKGHIEA